MSEVSESSHSVDVENLKSSESPPPPLYYGQHVKQFQYTRICY